VNVLLFFSIVLSLLVSFNQLKSVYLFALIVMSEQKIEDESGGAATEQNPMVQRISLEVQRREPSSVSIDLIISNLIMILI